MRSNIKLIVGVVASLCVGATTFFSDSVYGSVWWLLLWVVVGLLLIYFLSHGSLLRRKILWCFHFSMLLILIGGGVTALFSTRGIVHLSPGDEVSGYVDENGVVRQLPEKIGLRHFEVDYYPGMSFPRDFKSVITVGNDSTEQIVSMNRIGHLAPRERVWDDFRIYQTSYDGKGGTVLTVNHDPLGIGITYGGYILFFISGLLMLLKRLCLKHALCVLIALGSFMTVDAAPAVPASLGDSLKSVQVRFRGKTVPFDYMARRVALTLTGKDKVGELDATRFVASLCVYSEEWRNMAFIRVKEKELARRLGIDGRYVSPRELYSADGHYIPESIWEGGEGNLDDAILRLDEKVAVLAELWEGKLFNPLPGDDPDCISKFRMWLILSYDRIRPVMIFFIFAFLMSVMTIICGIRKRGSRAVYLWGILLSLWGITGFIWHWLADGEAPLVVTQDLFYFTAVMLSVVILMAVRKMPVMGGIGYLATMALALVAWLGSRTPQLTPMLPVLSSPWLSVHVSVVMTSYALLIFSSLGGGVALAVKERSAEMVPLCLRFTEWGVWLLGVGIWTGAMWANISWGRYWGWDPKETWALVTMLIYAIPLHRSMGLRSRSKALFIYLLLASLSIVMTYAGVNLLNSLHAYR